MRKQHAPVRAREPKTQRLVKPHGWLIIAMDVDRYLVVAKLFKVVTQHQLDGLARVTLASLRLSNIDPIAKCAVTRIAIVRVNRADRLAVTVLDDPLIAIV